MKRTLALLALCLPGCAGPPVQSGILCTAGEWDMPPAYHGNPWAPGGVGVARSYVFEGLFDYIPEDQRLIPRLGRSYQETGNRLIVHLEPGAVWHDGVPFTAEDVVATFEVGFLKGMEIWHYLDRVEAPDPHTVVFHWKIESPTNRLLALTEPIVSAAHLNQRHLTVVQSLPKSGANRDLEAEAARRELLFAERPPLPIGTGPFRVRKVTTSDMVLDRFEHYYRTQALRGVRIARWGRNEVIWSYLYAGQLDAISPACPYDVAQEILRRNPNLSTRNPSDMNEMGLVINCRDKPLNQLSFRQGLAYGLNRDAIRQLACAPGDTSQGLSLGLVPSQAERWLGPRFSQDLTRYRHAPELARQHLSRPERELEVMAPAGFTDLALLAEAAAAQLTLLGVPASVRLVQGELYAQLLMEGKFDLAAVFGAQMGPTVHPSTSEGRFFARDAQLERASGLPRNQQAEKWVDDLRVSMDEQHTRQLCAQLARLQNESVSFIPCFEKRLLIFVQDGPRVTGWPPADSPLWSAAPLGVERLYCSLAVQGLLRPAP
ncbi:MAG: ABC transporter substrate-binding protein [Vulcanimicrobiota bacterium]